MGSPERNVNVNCFRSEVHERVFQCVFVHSELYLLYRMSVLVALSTVYFISNFVCRILWVAEYVFSLAYSSHYEGNLCLTSFLSSTLRLRKQNSFRIQDYRKTSEEVVAFVRDLTDSGYRFTYIDHETTCRHCREVVITKIFCDE